MSCPFSNRILLLFVRPFFPENLRRISFILRRRPQCANTSLPFPTPRQKMNRGKYFLFHLFRRTFVFFSEMFLKRTTALSVLVVRAQLELLVLRILFLKLKSAYNPFAKG